MLQDSTFGCISQSYDFRRLKNRQKRERQKKERKRKRGEPYRAYTRRFTPTQAGTVCHTFMFDHRKSFSSSAPLQTTLDNRNLSKKEGAMFSLRLLSMYFILLASFLWVLSLLGCMVGGSTLSSVDPQQAVM